MRVPAKQKLRRWLETKRDEGWTQKKLADAVSAKQSSVSRWCDDQNKERPNEQRQRLLEGVTGIAQSDWWTAKERRAAAKVSKLRDRSAA